MKMWVRVCRCYLWINVNIDSQSTLHTPNLTSHSHFAVARRLCSVQWISRNMKNDIDMYIRIEHTNGVNATKFPLTLDTAFAHCTVLNVHCTMYIDATMTCIYHYSIGKSKCGYANTCVNKLYALYYSATRISTLSKFMLLPTLASVRGCRYKSIHDQRRQVCEISVSIFLSTKCTTQCDMALQRLSGAATCVIYEHLLTYLICNLFSSVIQH